MAATMTPCSAAILAEKNIMQIALKASRFSQALSHESFTSKCWLSCKVETWNFTKSTLLKLVNLMKAEFLFVELNMNIIIQKKMHQKKARIVDDALN